jgi:hypothetical protein
MNGKPDTSDWTVEQHIAWIRNYATGARTMANLVTSWAIDIWKVEVGMAEIVDWPPVSNERRLRRGQNEPDRPEGTRVVFQGGFAYLVRDVA